MRASLRLLCVSAFASGVAACASDPDLKDTRPRDGGVDVIAVDGDPEVLDTETEMTETGSADTGVADTGTLEDTTTLIDTGTLADTGTLTDTGTDTGPFDTGALTDTGSLADTGTDTGPFDTGTLTDTGTDTGPFDTGPLDSGMMTTDTAPFDTGPLDSGMMTTDTGPFDTFAPDSAPADTALPDSAPADTTPADSAPLETEPADSGATDSAFDSFTNPDTAQADSSTDSFEAATDTAGEIASDTPSDETSPLDSSADDAPSVDSTEDPTTPVDSASSDSSSSMDSTAESFAPGYSHTLSVDGDNDFTAQEKLGTTSGGYAAYATWDASYVYLGYEGPDIGSSSTAWVLAYFDTVAGGATKTQQYNTQQHLFTSTFAADTYFAWKSDGSFHQLYQYDASTSGWTVVPAMITPIRKGTFVEMAIPRAAIGATATKLGLTTFMLEERSGAEWTYAGMYTPNFADGYSASGTPKTLMRWMDANPSLTVAPNDPSREKN